MNKKQLRTLGFGILGALLISSCVDQNYDLNNGISNDVNIPDNTITLPIGSLKAVMLDSLIDLEEVDILKKGEDDVYCISKKEEIDPIEEVIDPIKLSIDPVKELVDIEFTEAEITTVHLEAEQVEPAKFETPNISIDDLEDNLPYLKNNVSQSITSPELEQLFIMMDNDNFDPSTLPAQVELSQTISIENETVGCDINYALPEEIETIYSIQFGDKNTQGALVEVVISHPAVLNDIDKKIDFEIQFPENYKLSTYSNAEQADKYIVSSSGNSIKATSLNAEGEKTIVSFYLNEMIKVDSHISNGTIKVEDQIVYNVHYKVNGYVVPTEDLKRDDFKFNVSLDMPLGFHDAKGVTKDYEVSFDPVTMDFDGHFDNLQYIDHIEYVDFDETLSRLKLGATIDGDWMEYFHIKEGYALKLKLPKDLTICPIHSEFDGKGKEVVYNEAEHAFYVYDLKKLESTQWNIALQKLVLDVPVVEGECDMNIHTEVVSVGPNGEELDYILFEREELESMMSALNTLKGDKYADFIMNESDLVIKDAVVHTETILSNLDTHTEFDFNEEVPSEIGRIESVDFKEDALIRFDMSVLGLDDLGTDIDLDLHAKLPSFFKVTPLPSSNPYLNALVKGDSLIVKAKYNPQTDDILTLELKCSGLDFKTEEFGGIGLVPRDSIDGKSYLVYSGEIVVEGEASIHGMEFHSQVLDSVDDIKLDIEMAVGEMEVKTFHGIYEGEIDPIQEIIALDLGEDLDFLREDGNTITLAEPQIEFEIENSISVPVDVDLHIYGVDNNGQVIPTSNIHEKLSINPADYNMATGEITARKTKLFLTSSSELEPIVGYEKVLIPELATLLEKVPDSIYINITPIVDTSVTHHVDVSQPLRFSGSYGINIPLKFENLNLCYNDTITDINADLGETLSKFSNVSLSAKMNIANTIPLGLALNVTPLDENGNIIDDITIKPINIKPGLGGDIMDIGNSTEQETQTIEFKISSNKTDISVIDKLGMSITAATDHVSGSVGLKGCQGIKISDIVIILKGDIETEL